MSRHRMVFLFVPGDRPDYFNKAAESQADTIIFDLEDGVACSGKEESRVLVEQALQGRKFGSRELAIRINPLSTPWGLKDLEMIRRCSAINVILLPKAEPGSVKKVNEALEKENISILCLIETAFGLQKAYETAKASSRVNGLMLGAEDLAAELNLERTVEGTEIQFARQVLVLAANAAGVQPIDTPFLMVSDLDSLAEDAKNARKMGFTAKAALSPRQVPVIRKAFLPCLEEVKQAKKIVGAAEQAELRGRGIVIVDGAMVDRPVVSKARRVIELAGEDDLDGC